MLYRPGGAAPAKIYKFIGRGTEKGYIANLLIEG
jgi:hypothetical protein